MESNTRADAPGVRHHVILRGVLGLLIFLDDLDRFLFLDLAHKVFGEAGMSCFAWTLMGNHVHLFVETGHEPLSRAIGRLASQYARAFNRRHGRQGHLFQGRFWSIPVKGDAQWCELLRYILLNPVRAGVVEDLDALAAHPWCSFMALAGRGPERFVEVQHVLAQFGRSVEQSREGLIRFLLAGLEKYPRSAVPVRAPRTPVEALLQILDDTYPLDRSIVLDQIRKDRDSRFCQRERARRRGWTLERVIRDVCRRTGADEGKLRSGRRTALEALARRVVVQVSVHRLGMKRVDVAREVGVSPSGVSRLAGLAKDLTGAWGPDLDEAAERE